MRIKLWLLLTLAVLCAGPARANVVVAIQTVVGPIELELFDAATPLTAANFLDYADSHDYDQSIVHRSVPGFVIQGGGYKIIAGALDYVAVNPPSVLNEPGISNLRGTVAMAKLGGLPDSATTEWFVNLADNLPLDTNNGGYTVFADVISGMSVVDAIAALIRVNIGSPFNELPVVNFTPPNPVMLTNLVVLSSVARQTAPQCGDLDADAQIDSLDIARLRASLANPAGAALSPAEAARCSVIGTASDCDIRDSTVLRRRLGGQRPLREQLCPAAT